MTKTTQGLKQIFKKWISILLAFLLVAVTLPQLPAKAASGDVTGNTAFRVIAYDTSARVEIPYISSATNYKVYMSQTSGLTAFTDVTCVLNSDTYKSSAYAINGDKDILTPAKTISIAAEQTYYFYLVTTGTTAPIQSTFEAATRATGACYWTSAGNYDTSWYDGGSGPFNISTAKQLAGLAVLVNGGNDFSGKTVNLTASIDLSAYLWLPIGTSTSKFNGTFDGGNYTASIYTVSNVINGLHTNNAAAKNVGLFGYSGGTIQNVDVTNGYLRGYENVGGIVGYDISGTVNNCFNTNSITGSESVSGVIGYLLNDNTKNITISNCYNTGTISYDGNKTVDGFGGGFGGVIGYGYVDFSSTKTIHILNCYNTGTINGSLFVGGVIGWIFGNNNGNALLSVIANCYNSGAVIGQGDYVGGVSGTFDSDCSVTNCYNTATVSGAQSVGGVVGSNYVSTTSDCYNTGAVTGTAIVGGVAGNNQQATLQNSYNTGAVSAAKDTYGNSYVGGVCGQDSTASALVTNVYNAGTVTGTGNYIGSDVGWIEYTASATACYYLENTAASGIGFIGSGLTGTSTPVTGTQLKNLAGTLGSGAWANAPTQYATGGVFSSTNQVNKGYPVLKAFGYTDGASGDGFSPDITVNSSTGAVTIGTNYGDGTTASPYIIRNAYQLDLVRNYLGSTNSAKVFKLANNIDISPTQYNKAKDTSGNWSPIGTLPPNQFAATFDGNSYTISGIYINSTLISQGLFGYLSSSATVKNLGMVDGTIIGLGHAGSILGDCEGATVIKNCFNTGSVTGAGTDTGAYVGGIVGFGGITANCYNVGTVSGTDNTVGGVAGGSAGITTSCYNLGTVTGRYCVGGVIGNSGGALSNCYNMGSICGTVSSAGGVVGGADAVVTNCYNTGAVNSPGVYVGGIAGIANCGISYCYNQGTVSSESYYVGGITGFASTTATNCYNTGAVRGDTSVGGVAGIAFNEASNCYSTGVVSGTQCGGVLGNKGNDIIIRNCYYYGCSIGIYGTASDTAGQTTAFVKLGASTINIGSATTLDKQSTTDINTAWSSALGANFSIAYPSYQSSATGVATIAEPTITSVAPGSTNITGALTITQNGLTASGFTGAAQQIIVPVSLPLTVTKATPTIAVSSIASPTVVGVPITLTATIAGGYSPAGGTVTFYNKGAAISPTSTLAGGTATISYTPNSLTALSITAVYGGDANNAVATSPAQTATVSQQTPSLSTPTVSPNSPHTYPVSVTLSSSLGNYYGTPLSGQIVSFYDGTTLIGSHATDTSGVATYTWNNPGAATHVITSKFAGNTNNTSAGSGGSTSYLVSKGTQTTPIISLSGGSTSVTYGYNNPAYKATASSSESTGAYQYSSSDTSVVSVDSTTGTLTVTGAGSATIYVKRLGDGNYNDSAENSVTITVARQTLTATITPNPKQYNGSPTATIKSVSYSGIVGVDDVSIAGGTLAFQDKAAAINKTVTASGYVLNGIKLADYALGTITVTTANITTAPLTVTNTAVNDKTYDGTTAATYTGTPALSGKVSGDDVNLTGTPTFASKDASANPIPVSYTGLTIDGADAANYSLTLPSPVSEKINQRTLSVSVNPLTILCGQAIPALTVNVSGFVNGESTSIIGFSKPTASQSYGSTTTAVTNAPLAVVYSGGAATNNYQFSYNNTTQLTINAAQNVSADDYQFTGNYSTTPNPSGWNSHDLTLTPTNGYTQISLDGGATWNSSLTVSTDATDGTATFKMKKADGTQSENTTIYYNLDKTAPTGKVTIQSNNFTSFLNTITFGLFFKQAVDVTIAGADTCSGVKTIVYQKVANGSTYNPSGTWSTYSNRFSVSPNEKFVVYAKITDNVGNETIINSNGVVVYTDSALASTTAYFNKDTTSKDYKDIPVTINLNSNALDQIKNGQYTLVKNTDYTLGGNTVTLKKEYLEKAVNGSVTLTFRFNPMSETFSQGNAPATSAFIVTEMIDTVAPSFTANLSGEKTYSKGDTATALTVKARAADSGTVTYQWYESSNSSINGTTIAGATDASYTPGTDTTGVFYYYVKATNTNDTVNGSKIAFTTSGIYKVTVNNLVVLAPKVSSDTPTTTMQQPSSTVEQAVITDTDKDKLAAGSNISIYLHVEKTDAPQADKSLILTALDGKTMGQYLDISLIKNIDGIETKVAETNNLLRITIDVPENLRASGRSFAIVRIHNGLAVTLADLDNDPNTITIETDRFSTYAIAYIDGNSTPEKNSDTGEHTSLIPLALFGFGSFVTALTIIKKRRYRVISKK